MPLGLRRGVSFCEASGHLVFLDIEADRYFGLADGAESAFRGLLQPQAQNAAGRAVDMFLECRLLVAAPDALPIRPCPDLIAPSTSLLDRPLPRPSPSAVFRALVAIIAARRALRLRGLASTLKAVAAQKACAPKGASDPARIQSEAAAFQHCSLLVRSHDQCLARSLALVRRLAAQRERANLVIGVRVRPFSAHAWVQKDDLLLNESCDAVRGYTSILIL